MRRAGFPFSRSGRCLLAAASLALVLAGVTSGTAMARVTAGTGGQLLPPTGARRRAGPGSVAAARSSRS